VVAEGGGGLGVVCGGGEFADVGEDVGGGAGGAAQVLGVESGDGGLDAGWEVAGVVVQDLGEPVPGVEGAGGGGPQRPDVVPGLVEAGVGLPQRASVQVFCGSPRIVEGFSMRLPGRGPRCSRS